MRQKQLPITQSGLRRHLQEVTLEEGQKLVVGYLQERVSEVLNLMPPRRRAGVYGGLMFKRPETQ